ncbi:MAG: hypothetical protein ACRD0B_06570 [Acidimicrobiales bacterium]
MEILHVPGCPHLGGLEARLRSATARLGLDVAVHTVEGAFPSPTLLVNGAAVAAPETDQACCRLEIPSEEEIVTALADAVPGST